MNEVILPNGKLLIGDSIHLMQQKLRPRIYDLVIADPPFGIENSESLYNRNSDFVIDGYQEVPDNYRNFTIDWIFGVDRVLKDDGSLLVFSGWTNLLDILFVADIIGLEMINHIILKKTFNPPTKHKFVSSHYHLIFYVKDKNNYYFKKPDWETKEERREIYHDMHDIWEMGTEYRPAKMKSVNKIPQRVIAKILKYCARPDAKVLDPFCGNGTVPAECARNGIEWTAIEINEGAAPVIKKQIEERLKEEVKKK